MQRIFTFLLVSGSCGVMYWLLTGCDDTYWVNDEYTEQMSFGGVILINTMIGVMFAACFYLVFFVVTIVKLKTNIKHNKI